MGGGDGGWVGALAPIPIFEGAPQCKVPPHNLMDGVENLFIVPCLPLPLLFALLSEKFFFDLFDHK